MQSKKSVTITSEGLGALQQHPLPKAASKVLWYLVKHAEDTGVPVTCDGICKDLRIRQRPLFEAMTKLFNARFVWQFEVHVGVHYTLNPDFIDINIEDTPEPKPLPIVQFHGALLH